MKHRFRKKFTQLSTTSFNVCVWHRKVGCADDVEVFERSVLYGSVDKVEWSFNIDLYSGKQYLTMTGTNYYLWIFESTVFEYVYELNEDTIKIEDMSNDQICGILRKLYDFEKYHLYQDELYDDTNSYTAVALLYNNDRWILKLGSDDFHFIRTK